MDYLTQAKSFRYRATDSKDLQEKLAHLSMSVDMLIKIEEERQMDLRATQGVASKRGRPTDEGDT